MSEIGETKQVYVRGMMVDDTVMFDEDLSFTIPAVPGLPEIAALIAEVGAEALRGAVVAGAELADHRQGQAEDDRYRSSLMEDRAWERDYAKTRDKYRAFASDLRRLAAALEVK